MCETDIDARTSLAGLFAAGEVACTGVHGANRLASNSLLEGLVFGARAAATMALELRPAHLPPDVEPFLNAPGTGDTLEEIDTFAVRDLMWRNVGLVRNAEGLREAVERLGRWRAAVGRDLSADGPANIDRWRLGRLVTVGLLIAHAALRREESRGGHFRADFPARDDVRWHRHVADVVNASGTPGSGSLTCPPEPWRRWKASTPP